MKYRIYHNPRCSKSRAALALLRERGVEPEIVEYLANPPSDGEIEQIIALLDVPAGDLVRTTEARAAGIGKALADGSASTIAAAIAKYPQILQRPVVVAGDERAVIGRPPENVLALLDDQA